MDNVEDFKPSLKKIGQLATRRANMQVATAKWNLNIMMFTYAILVTVILLRLDGLAVQIISPIVIVGLAIICFVAWRQWKRLYKDLYAEELCQLEELFEEYRVETLTSQVLSQREVEILSYIARGYANKQIATKLNISANTVKNHVSFIIRKLNVNDRTHAVALAIHNGWMSSQLQLSESYN